MNHSSSPESANYPQSLTPDRFHTSCERARELTKGLRVDYPSTKPYLVVAIAGEFVREDTSLIEKLKTTPAVFRDNSSKTAVLKHLRKDLPKELHQKGNETRLKRWKQAWENRLTELSTGLRLKPDALFEIRFGHLHYEEIWKMQTDPRVDRTRTPQSKASIRIVLGSLTGIG